jgi:hypothetical protein
MLQVFEENSMLSNNVDDVSSQDASSNYSDLYQRFPMKKARPTVKEIKPLTSFDSEAI